MLVLVLGQYLGNYNVQKRECASQCLLWGRETSQTILKHIPPVFPNTFLSLPLAGRVRCLPIWTRSCDQVNVTWRLASVWFHWEPITLQDHSIILKLIMKSLVFIFYTFLVVAKLSKFHWFIAQGQTVLQSCKMLVWPDLVWSWVHHYLTACVLWVWLLLQPWLTMSSCWPLHYGNFWVCTLWCPICWWPGFLWSRQWPEGRSFLLISIPWTIVCKYYFFGICLRLSQKTYLQYVCVQVII